VLFVLLLLVVLLVVLLVLLVLAREHTESDFFGPGLLGLSDS
jgi:hypothetical protein